MGLMMSFVVEPVMGGLNTALNNGLMGMGGTSKVVLGMILGGMMAIDMGGPFNKAAYVFGSAAIAAGNYDIMAAVMIGGMTPPSGLHSLLQPPPQALPENRIFRRKQSCLRQIQAQAPDGRRSPSQ